MSVQRVSQRDIARKANVHFTTVSLALRNSPSLPVETRERIQALAKEMGYRPDPMLSALQAYRKTVKSTGFEGTIAWINTHKVPSDLYIAKFTRIYLESARLRCEELGYKLEEFNLSGMSATRLSNILQARNIQGLLLPPQPHNRAHLNFDWSKYSAVAFGHSLSRPRLHMVTNAQYGTARLGARVLRKYGYHRIGFVTTRGSDERTDQNFSSGYLAEQRRGKSTASIPLLLLSDENLRVQQKEFLQWYKKYKPDVVMTFYEHVPSFMVELNIPYTECGLALLILNASNETHQFAGVDQNDATIARSAVDFVVGMIHRNERGIPKVPVRILVEGKWVDGRTVFRQNVPKASKKAVPQQVE